MRKRSLFRGIMLAAGLIAVCCILLGQSFSARGPAESERAITQQPADDGSLTFISTPTDAIPGTALQVEDDSSFSVIKSLIGKDDDQQEPIILAKEAAGYLKVLFRAIISPNAP